MHHWKRGARALFAIVALASAQLAAADFIDYPLPYLTTNGDTLTHVVPGGQIAYMVAYDTSSVHISGGHVSHLFANNAASVTMMFGDVSHLTLNDSTNVVVGGGEVGHLTLTGSARGTVANGTISWLNVYDNSTATLLGAPALSWLVVSETSHVDIYVADAVYGNGHLSGTWQDGTPFEFWVAVGTPGTPSTSPPELPPNITVIPATSVSSAR